MFPTKVRFIPEYSIVRLPEPDNRVGYLEKHTNGGKPQVRVAPDRAVEVSPRATVAVLSYPAQSAWDCLSNNLIGVACPHCGDPAVPIWADELDGLHTGVTAQCPKCKCGIVFEVTSPDAKANAIAFLQERAACGGWSIPDTPEEIAAWALDEMTVQIELAQDYPDEAADRMASAAQFAELAASRLWRGAVPATLPWDRACPETVAATITLQTESDGRPLCPECGDRLYTDVEQVMKTIPRWDEKYGGFYGDFLSGETIYMEVIKLWCQCGWVVDPRQVEVIPQEEAN